MAVSRKLHCIADGARQGVHPAKYTAVRICVVGCNGWAMSGYSCESSVAKLPEAWVVLLWVLRIG